MESVKTNVLILKSGACGWGGCVFCGYGRIRGYSPTKENLTREFDRFFKTPADAVKVFGSGSFFDEKQVPAEMREHFIRKCVENRVKCVTVESRPEYVNGEKIQEFRKKSIKLTVAIGLEAADDRILKKMNKGFTLRDYERACRMIRANKASVRTYLLANLPYVRDVRKKLNESVKYVLKHSDSVVVINLLPHGDTPLFRLWVDGEWNFLDRKEFDEITSGWRGNPKVEFDFETFRFIPKFPEKRRLVGVGEEYLTHKYFEVWQDYLVRFYTPPAERDILLILPCSHKKPYSESETHRKILAVLGKSKFSGRIHEVMVSNPGLIPREFEDNYPFNAYDWDETLETKEVKKRYIQVTAERVERYLKKHRCSKILCYLKYDSESYKALERACFSLNLGFENLLDRGTYERIKDQSKPLQTEEALKSMEKNLSQIQIKGK